MSFLLLIFYVFVKIKLRNCEKIKINKIKHNKDKYMKFFNNGWDKVLEDEFEKDYFKNLLTKVDEEYEKLN